MSQQGETDHRQEDHWWQRLYGESEASEALEAPDTGPPAAPDPHDSVDTHFTSALGALGAADTAPVVELPRQQRGPSAPPPDPETLLDLDVSLFRAAVPADAEPDPAPDPVDAEPDLAAYRDADQSAPAPAPTASHQAQTPDPAALPPDIGAAADPLRQYPGPPAPSAWPQPTRGPGRPTSSGRGLANWPAAPGLPPGWAPVGERQPEGESAPSFELAPAKPRGPVRRPAGPAPAAREPQDPAPGTPSNAPPAPHVGDQPPVYEPEPTAWPHADPEDLESLVPDTELDGARYGVLALRTASVRGDSARYRGEPRRDAVLTARFGTGDDALLLLAVATGARAADDAHRAARDACRWIAGAVGRSHVRLSEDIRAARRGSLKSGLHRLTDRCYGRLRARGAELGLPPDEYSAALRCLLLPVDPACRIRLFFGAGDGGLFRIRGGEWQDLDQPPGSEAGDADFRFRSLVAHPGDALLLCSNGLAEPLRGEPALAAHLREQWGTGEAPGLAAFLGDVQTRVKGYADDRTVVAVWDT